MPSSGVAMVQVELPQMHLEYRLEWVQNNMTSESEQRYLPHIPWWHCRQQTLASKTFESEFFPTDLPDSEGYLQWPSIQTTISLLSCQLFQLFCIYVSLVSWYSCEADGIPDCHNGCIFPSSLHPPNTIKKCDICGFQRCFPLD